jgi:uncharacterized membrane protein YkvA (DUF1232 family)
MPARRRRRPALLAIAARPVAVLRFLRDPKAGVVPRLALVFAIVYAIVPVDLIPDAIPFLGWLDDLGILAIVFGWTARRIAAHAERPQVAPPA